MNHAPHAAAREYGWSVTVARTASSQYAVRFAEMTFGERVLEVFATMGDDAFAAIGIISPRVGVLSEVVEIVDRITGRVVARMCESFDGGWALYHDVFVDLGRLDVASFEEQWHL